VDLVSSSRSPENQSLTSLDLHGIANMMYPLTENLAFNPIRDRWFEVILKDETWFFTIIYVAARQLEAEHGANESSQQVSRLMNHVLGRLKDSVEKARQGHAPPDAVIGAVSCLVSLEVPCHDLSTKSHYLTLHTERPKQQRNLASPFPRPLGTRQSKRRHPSHRPIPTRQSLPLRHRGRSRHPHNPYLSTGTPNKQSTHASRPIQTPHHLCYSTFHPGDDSERYC
jgi:hypothetical protein